jgi:MFS family permease
MTNDLMRHYSIHSTQLGVLTSFYYYPYVLLQIPCGIIVDLFGPRLVIVVSASITGLAVYLFSTGYSLGLALFSRLLLGIGSACVFISCLKLISVWFPKEKFGRLCGFTNFMGTMGGLLAGYPLAHAVHVCGWRNTYLYLFIIGGILLLLVFYFIRNKETVHLTHNFKSNFLSGIKRVIKSQDMWLIGICNGLMYVPITGFVELWATPFFTTMYRIPVEQASSMSVLIFAGSAVGSTIWPKIADYVRSYVLIMKISNFITTILFLCMIIGAGMGVSLPIIKLLLIMIGMAVSGKILSFAWVNSYCHVKDTGVGLGFCNALTMLSGLIFQPLFGFILDKLWSGNLDHNSVPIYNPNEYIYSALCVPIALVVCFIIMNFIADSYQSDEVLVPSV